MATGSTFPPKHSALIVNPAAAAGKAGRRWDRINQGVYDAFGDVPTFLTEHEGHASEIAEALVRGGTTGVLVIGGDGTNNEVVHGIMTARSAMPGETVTLGQLPFGTGGDFRRVLENSTSFDAALRSLPTAPTYGCDVGKLDFIANDGQPATRYFLNIADFGIGGLVDRHVNSSPKWLGGKISFYLGTVRGLFGYKAARCELYVDEEFLGVFDVMGVFVCNSRFAGGGMQFAPEAMLDDGLFDVVVIPEMPLWDALSNLGALYQGKHLERDGVIFRRGRRVEAKPVGDSLGLLDVDGEAPGRIPATFNIVPNAIRVANVISDVRVNR